MASFNQENVSRKPNAVFPDMPYHVKQKIARFTDAHTQLSLNRVSKECKKLVDNVMTHYKGLEIEFEDDSISMSLQLSFFKTMGISVEQVGTSCIVHTDDLSYELVENTYKKTNVRKRFEKANSNASEKAAELAFKYLLNPKCSFQHLSITEDDDLGESFFEILRERLPQMEHKLHVETFFGSPIPFKFLLPYLKPRVLQEVDLLGGIDIILLRSLTRFEQWRHATKISVGCPSDLLLEDLINASRIDLAVELITRSHFETMLEICGREPTKSITVGSDEEIDTWITQHLKQFKFSDQNGQITYELSHCKVFTSSGILNYYLTVEGKSV